MKRIAPLDGLRGAAALAVVVAHYFGEVAHGTAALSFGWIGVGVFFVLSGYLISATAFERWHQPDFVQCFYVRRAVRILPVYLITVSTSLVVLDLCASRTWAVPAFGLPIYLSFTQNIALALHGKSGLWLLPTWTLAVEEQFYLVLPLLIGLVPRQRHIGLFLCLAAGAVAFRLYTYNADRMAALVLLPAKADLLLSGVVAAWLQRRFDLSQFILPLRVIPLVAALALLGVTLVDRDRLFTIVGPLVVGIGAASFILSLALGAPESRRFCGSRIVHIGRMSYALYLVHQPINGLLHGLILDGTPDIGTPAQLLVTSFAVVISMALAHASWRYLEKPLLSWARTLRTAAADRSDADGFPSPTGSSY